MKQWMESIYSGFRHIGVIGEVQSKWDDMEAFVKTDDRQINRLCPAEIASACVTTPPLDLLIIDVDTLGIENSLNAIFLARCFIPNTPIVLITEQPLSPPTRKKLHDGQVLELFQLNNSNGAPAYACA